MFEKLARESLVGTTGGLLIWSVYFVVVYAWLSMACATGVDRMHLVEVNTLRLTLVLLTAATCLMVAYIGWCSLVALRAEDPSQKEEYGRESRRFLAWLAAGVAALALVSTVWVSLPIFLVTPCA